MPAQTVDRPHRELVSQFSRVFFNPFGDPLLIGFIRFGRSSTAGLGHQFFDSPFAPTFDPGVNRWNTYRLHVHHFFWFVSEMHEPNGCAALTDAWARIALHGSFDNL